jgi:very-short-patch-repair endonuclease
MPRKNIITGQQVSTKLHKQAEHMRRAMTSAEHKLWQYLRAGRLEGFHFRRQQVINNYIVDFYCHKASLVVELDGSGHIDQRSYDLARDAHLKGLGLHVLRFYNTDVDRDIETVLGVILEACRARKD